MVKEQKTLNTWEKVRLATLRCSFYTLSLLPLSVLYAISDFFYLILYRLIGYRVKVVRSNIDASFPDKSEKERRKIESGFYHWLCDYFLETVKLTSMSQKEMKRRMRFENTELPKRILDGGRSVILFLGHYCNWEWVSSMPLHIGNMSQTYPLMQIYHPLENPVMNKMFLQIRERMGAISVNMNDTLRALIGEKKAGRPSMTGFIADQTPHWDDIHVWIPFLNHPNTPFFTGGERIAKKLDFAVLYLDMQRPRRGYYTGTFRMITENPKEAEDYKLTEKYAALMEESILRQPAFWLWSHKRWKRTREEYDRRLRENGHL